MSDESLLENVVCVHLDVDVPTGKKANLAEDLRLQKVPPSELMSLGQKQTFNPSLVKPLNTIRRRGERICLRYGTRFMGGFAIPLDRKQEVVSELNEAECDFNSASVSFFNEYPEAVKAWASQAGEWAPAVANAADPLDRVKAKTKFAFHLYRLSPVDESEELPVNGIVSNLYHEVAVEAAQTYRESLEGKSVATHAIRRPFQRFREKLDGLSFLDCGIGSVVSRIDEVLDKLPPKGQPIEGTPLVALQGLALLLRDTESLRNFASASQTDDESQDVDEEDTQPAPTSPEAPADSRELEEALCGDADDSDDEEQPETENQSATSGWFVL